MELASSHDMLAREWITDFPVSRVIGKMIDTDPESIIHAHLFVLSKYPDTLITRKLGMNESKKISMMAQSVLDSGMIIKDFDDYLRAEGNKRNPGTTADLIVAGLFLKLLKSH